MLKHNVLAALSRYELADTSPIIVAYSGGGDSTALLYLALKWAKPNNKHVIAALVDHGMRKGSAKESQLAVKRANAMGAGVRVLHWQGPKPKTALQAKARQARYALLANLCRELGARRCWLGHNLDDQIETVKMRIQSGSGWRGLAAMTPRAAAPIWPELYGIEIHRPMLGARREDIRVFNTQNSLKYIDDPSNSSRDFTRVRTRAFLAENREEKARLLAMAKAARETLVEERRALSSHLYPHFKWTDWGGGNIDLEFLNQRPGAIAEILRYLLPAISGQGIAPSAEKRFRFAKTLKQPDFKSATLGGVLFQRTKTEILCMKDLGAIRGRAGVERTKPILLRQGETQIWDGRFAVKSKRDGVKVDALANIDFGLTKELKVSLKACPLSARGTLPVCYRGHEFLHIPTIFNQGSAEAIECEFIGPQHLNARFGEFV